MRIPDGIFRRNREPDFVAHVRAFHKNHSVWPNIFKRQRELSFNEKILHRMLFDRREILPRLTDKYVMRAEVERIVGDDVLPTLYHVTADPEAIPFHTLPQGFVVKPTHTSGQVHIVRNKLKEFDLDTEEGRKAWAALITKCHTWLSESYYEKRREWQYKAIPPRILIEELIDDGSDGAPIDYKILVFGGKAELIQVHKGRYTPHHTITHFDREWKKLDVSMRDDGCQTEDTPRPAQLDNMLRTAEVLSEEWDFLRVDFYRNREDTRIYLGELTLTPGNGGVPFDPIAFDMQQGRLWKLKNRIPSFLWYAAQEAFAGSQKKSCPRAPGSSPPRLPSPVLDA